MILVHRRRAEEESANVVGELVRHDCGTAILDVRTVVDAITLVHQAHVHHPVPSPHRPVHVGGIPSIECQARSNVEEARLRNRILVVITVVPSEYLPSQPAIAVFSIPPGRLRIKHGLGKS